MDGLLPSWASKLPDTVKLLIAGAVALHVVGLLVVVGLALRSGKKGKQPFSDTLSNKSKIK
jgi:hypothetical protein